MKKKGGLVILAALWGRGCCGWWFAAGGEEGQLVVICFYPGGVCIISWGRFNSRVGFVGPPPPPTIPNHLNIWTNILTNTSFSYSRNLRNHQGHGTGVPEKRTHKEQKIKEYIL